MIVGVTGGIGSGKTTVLSSFKSIANIGIYIADKEAKLLMNTSPDIKSNIVNLFGEEAYIEDVLNREYLSSIVFADHTKLSKLNAIVHPAVYSHFSNFVEQHAAKDYILYETAILFENGSDALCDVSITVIADKDLRLKRVCKRDRVDESTVVERMKHQWSDTKKMMLSNYIIENNEGCDIDSQIARIHKKLTEFPH